MGGGASRHTAQTVHLSDPVELGGGPAAVDIKSQSLWDVTSEPQSPHTPVSAKGNGDFSRRLSAGGKSESRSWTSPKNRRESASDMRIGREQRRRSIELDGKMAVLSEHVRKGNLDAAKMVVSQIEGLPLRAKTFDDITWKQDKQEWLQHDALGWGASIDNAANLNQDNNQLEHSDSLAAQEFDMILSTSNAMPYRKINPVHAFRTDTPVHFQKEWGTSIAPEGGFVIANRDGDLYANSAEEFESTYAAVPGADEGIYRKKGVVLAKCVPHPFRLANVTSGHLALGKANDFVVQSSGPDKELQYIISAADFHANYTPASPLVAEDGAAHSKSSLSAVEILKSVDDEVWDFLRAHVSDWDLDLFELSRMTPTRCPLFILAHHLFFERLSLVSDLGVQTKLFASFLAEVDNTYLPVCYHNSLHAADVLHGAFYMCETSSNANLIPAAERFAFLIAAMCNNIAHPGTSNQFQVDSHAAIATKFNDSSVLENFHAGLTFRILHKDAYRGMLPDAEALDPRMLRVVVIKTILATDLAESERYFGEWDHRTALGRDGPEAEDKFSLDNMNDRILWMQMALKCADISHPTKARSLHLRWSEMTRLEFADQGSKEEILNIPHRFTLTTDPIAVAKSQAGFIRFIVYPCYSRFCTQADQGNFWMSRLRDQESRWNAAAAAAQSLEPL
jgi:hypothetical protein